MPLKPVLPISSFSLLLFFSKSCWSILWFMFVIYVWIISPQSEFNRFKIFIFSIWSPNLPNWISINLTWVLRFLLLSFFFFHFWNWRISFFVFKFEIILFYIPLILGIYFSSDWTKQEKKIESCFLFLLIFLNTCFIYFKICNVVDISGNLLEKLLGILLIYFLQPLWES